jgi:hypothetical protein
MRNRKEADTIVPKSPPNCCKPELLSETAPNTAFSAISTPRPITTTMVEWPREKK